MIMLYVMLSLMGMCALLVVLLISYGVTGEIRDSLKNWKWQGKRDRVRAINNEIAVVRERITKLKRQKAPKEVIDQWENRLIELHKDLVDLSEWFTGPESERGRDWFANDGIDASTNAYRGMIPA